MKHAGMTLALGLAATAMVAASVAQAQRYDTYGVARLRTLDKATARVSTIDVPVGDVVSLGTLEIIVRSCQKRPPEEPPEAAAFLDIWELKPDEPAQDLFRGWMFASSPALSAMDHPVYDVSVLDCTNSASTTESTSASGASE